MLWEVKIQTQYTNIKEIIKEGPLKIGYLGLAFVAIENQRSAHFVQLAWCWAMRSQAMHIQFK